MAALFTFLYYYQLPEKILRSLIPCASTADLTTE